MDTAQLLTKSTTFIIGQVAQLLGYLMNGIFWVLDKIGIPNIGLAIIIFTVVIYMALLPLTIKQQKFSKLSAIMNPELQAIRNKYKGKTDNDSMMKQQQESQEVYKKYGVSQTGSCVQLAIQFPILFALYRVIYNFPAYVSQVRNAFFPLVSNMLATSGMSEYLQGTKAAATFAKQFSSDNFVNNVGETVSNTYIDVLNRFSTTEWTELGSKFSALSGDITNTVAQLEKYNNFLGLNIGNSPWYSIKNAADLSAGSGSPVALIIFMSILIPILAALTQLINVALMPQPAMNADPNSTEGQMASSMKTMNYIMPVMSAWFCFTLPAGMGIYWVAGAAIRSIQQVAINKHINNMDMDKYIAENVEKAKKKNAKHGGQSLSERMLSGYANVNTKSLKSQAQVSTPTTAQKKEDLEKAKSYYENKKYKSGSLASKANMVSEYNSHKNKTDN